VMLFDDFLQAWLAWLAASSWQLALLISAVAVLTRLLRATSPRLRHALWLLVLAKVFLPPGLATPVSVGRWVVGPLGEILGLPARGPEPFWPLAGGERPRGSLVAGPENATEPALTPSPDRPSPSLLLAFCVWSAGCLSFWSFVLGRYVRLVRTLNSFPTIDEGPIRVALERAAIQLRLRRIPDVVAAELVTSPFLLGLLRPRVVLPQSLLGRWTDEELRAVLMHELAHWRRGDTWIGWLQTTAQGLFWFHPFLWWAGGQLRHHRECACDEMVLRLGAINPQQYGETIVDMLAAVRGRSLASGSLVGILEEGSQLTNRLEEIMNYDPLKRRFGSFSRLAIVTTAVLLLPMSPGAGERRAVLASDDDAAEKTEASDPYARIVKSSPRQGATDVEADLGEISVTFDRDMEPGMSWTGGPPLFPPLDKSRQARWTDKRTCVLPVKLQAGTYYRLGINSSSFQNFRAEKGDPAATAAVYFCTKGATEEVEGRVRVPAILAIEPKNGATDVDPDTKSLKVTFSIPMGQGMSWTGGGESFPKLPNGKSASWSDDGLTCTLPVTLEPDHDYELGLNSVFHNNFQSKWGVPSEAVTYKFHTRPAGAAGASK
jgi:beta-lactamase regulating signal transducer with metallopeptidase domain